MPTSLRFTALALALLWFAGCAQDRRHVMVVDVARQEMTVLDRGVPVAVYPVSTSKFGLGDGAGTYRTPVGTMKVRKKIGSGAPEGAVFKSRRPTGEILPVNAPGRDPIVTRILWLDGLEPRNRQAFDRHIYIHGTPEERTIGQPASFGCIRMRSRDVVALYDRVGVGARVQVILGEAPVAPVPVPATGDL